MSVDAHGRVRVPLVWGPTGPRGGSPGWLIDDDEALFALHAAIHRAADAGEVPIPSNDGSRLGGYVRQVIDLFAAGHEDWAKAPREPGVVGFAFEATVAGERFLLAERQIFDRWRGSWSPEATP